MRWKLLVAGTAVLCALGIAAAVLLVGRGGSGAAATPAGTTTTGFAIIDTPTAYCIGDTEHGKTHLRHWADEEQKMATGCPGVNVP